MKCEFLLAVGSAFSCQLWVRSFHPLWVRSFGFLSPGSSNAESADFAQILVGAAAMAFHELLGFELFTCVQHALSRAARGLQD